MVLGSDNYNSLKRDVEILGLTRLYWGLMLVCLSSLFVIELILSFFVNTNSLIFFLGMPVIYITAIYVRNKGLGNNLSEIMRLLARRNTPTRIQGSVTSLHYLSHKEHGKEKQKSNPDI